MWHVLKERIHKAYPNLSALKSSASALTMLYEAVEDVWEGVEIDLVNNITYVCTARTAT